ncbi:MAG: DUF4292 domain-containing protein [Candidatus Kapaibacterium sp.]
MLISAYRAAVVIFVIAFIAGCGSAKKTSESALPNLKLRDKIEFMEMDTELSINVPGLNNKASSRIYLAPGDSLASSVFGPFGIIIAKLFATTDEFLILNTLKSEAYKGRPDYSRIKQLTGMEIDFSLLSDILINKIPGEMKGFILVETLDDGSSLFKRVNEGINAEFIIIDREKRFTQYQAKNSANELVVNIFYRNFKKAGDYELPYKIAINSPIENMEIVINIKQYTLDQKPEKPYSFEIPSNFKIIRGADN